MPLKHILRSWLWASSGSDTLGYKCRLLNHKVPRLRNIYRVLASLYDPLGFIIPFTTRAKVFVQCLWSKARDWDDPVLPKDAIFMWTEWQEAATSSDIPIMLLRESSDGEARARTVHIFCDTSERAYGAVAYLHSEGQDGCVEVSFLTACSRVLLRNNSPCHAWSSVQ